MEKINSMADEVFEELEDDILSDKFKKGDTLSENKLSAVYGVSRTPVREALKRLETENLIEYANDKLVKVVGMTKEDILDVYDIRFKIEGMAVRKALNNVNEQYLKTLKDVLDLQAYYVLKGDADKIRKSDSDFHATIYEMIESPIYSPLLFEMHKKTQLYRKFSVQNPGRAQLATIEHKNIYEALLSKDGDRLEEAVTTHVINAKNSILNLK